MQEKQDYIMMQIEQLGRVLGKILADMLGLKSGNASGAYEMVAESFQTDLDVDIERLIYMSDVEFNSYISECLFKSPKLFNQLAAILVEAANFQYEEESRVILYKKALLLYKMEIKITKTFSVSNQKRMNDLELLIHDLKQTL